MKLFHAEEEFKKITMSPSILGSKRILQETSFVHKEPHCSIVSGYYYQYLQDPCWSAFFVFTIQFVFLGNGFLILREWLRSINLNDLIKYNYIKYIYTYTLLKWNT